MKLTRKKIQPLVIAKVPFPAARLQEAIDAVSSSFWRITRERVEQPEYQEAWKQFQREMDFARSKALINIFTKVKL